MTKLTDGQGFFEFATQTPVDPRNSVQAGDWVAIYAQVVNGSPTRNEITVELFSKSDQYQAVVLANNMIPLGCPPDFAPLCSHMFQKDGMFLKCGDGYGHEGIHQVKTPDGAVVSWESVDTVGYFEAR